MITVGIDKIAFYTAQYALDLAVLAKARGIDPEKYSIGLGQTKMSVPPPGEDIITLATNAAEQVLRDEDLNQIEMLLFATESSIDQSKAAAVFVHELLNLPPHCRSVELKQACYAATAAMQLALSYLRNHPDKKILVLASDVARYGLNTPGESSQGCGAVAMLLSAHPRLLALESEYGIVTESVMDFWRPNYLDEALVDGKYSSKLYLTLLEKSWQRYHALSGRKLSDHDYICYHAPVPRLVEKAHAHLQKINSETSDAHALDHTLDYCRQTGNSYTASLYVSLISLLETNKENLSGKRIGFYSYGSGCVAEFFSGIVQPTYQSVLQADYHQQLLNNRQNLSYEQYEAFYNFKYDTTGAEQVIPDFKTGHFKLTKLQNHKRIYANTTKTNVIKTDFAVKKKFMAADNTIKVNAPGKIILSGEHAIVHGVPALAMAINLYVTATISKDQNSQVSFEFADLAHRSRIPFSALHHLKTRIKDKYHRFIRGDFNIRDVLGKPFELAQFALSLLSDVLDPLHHGAQVHLQSGIPIGCGLGSSAATIVSVMQAMASYANISLSKEEIYKLALEAENMQHGKSSGLDLQVALQGGCLHVDGNKIEKRKLPTSPFYLINTGTPEVTTGQCVEAVKHHFASQSLKDEFAQVVEAMDKALYNQSWQEMQTAIRENHQLLVRIGVVPDKVKKFIHYVELMEGAAKICGAGAVVGENAGAVLVTCDDQTSLQKLSADYGYQILPISGESRGVHAA